MSVRSLVDYKTVYHFHLESVHWAPYTTRTLPRVSLNVCRRKINISSPHRPPITACWINNNNNNKKRVVNLNGRDDQHRKWKERKKIGLENIFIKHQQTSEKNQTRGARTQFQVYHQNGLLSSRKRFYTHTHTHTLHSSSWRLRNASNLLLRWGGLDGGGDESGGGGG